MGDVQPRKRKEKKKHKEDAIEANTRGTAALFGDGDFVMHSPSDHGTGGNLCTKIIFFTLLAILVGLLTLIMLENRAITEDQEDNNVKLIAKESAFPMFLDGWFETEEVKEEGHSDAEDTDLNESDDEHNAELLGEIQHNDESDQSETDTHDEIENDETDNDHDIDEVDEDINHSNEADDDNFPDDDKNDDESDNDENEIEDQHSNNDVNQGDDDFLDDDDGVEDEKDVKHYFGQAEDDHGFWNDDDGINNNVAEPYEEIEDSEELQQIQSKKNMEEMEVEYLKQQEELSTENNVWMRLSVGMILILVTLMTLWRWCVSPACADDDDDGAMENSTEDNDVQ